MKPPATMHTGPLGSTPSTFCTPTPRPSPRSPPSTGTGTSAGCASIPARGLITLMSPSFHHEDFTKLLDDVVEIAGEKLVGTVRRLRSTRLRRPGDPPGTGMEPDCAFYLGKRARDFRGACAEGVEAAEAFIERTAPDLVVEVELTNVDASKTERYAELGVRELWRLHGDRKSWEFRAEFLALRPGSAPGRLDASEVLAGLTPGRRARRGGRSTGRRNPRRSDEGGGTHRAAPPGRHGAGPRGGGGVLRGSGCSGRHSGGARRFRVDALIDAGAGIRSKRNAGQQGRRPAGSAKRPRIGSPRAAHTPGESSGARAAAQVRIGATAARTSARESPRS